MANYLALLYSDSKTPGGSANEKLARSLPDRIDDEECRARRMTPEAAGPLSFGWRLLSSKMPNAYEAVTYGKGHLGDSHASRNAAGA